MAELTSDDCKKFLTSKFPHTSGKDWKRVRKFKYQDKWCREFNAKQVGTVFLLENGQSFSFVKKTVIEQSEAVLVDSVKESKEEVSNSLVSYKLNNFDLMVILDIFNDFINNNLPENSKDADLIAYLFDFSMHKENKQVSIKISSKFEECIKQPRKLYESLFCIHKTSLQETMQKLSYVTSADIKNLQMISQLMTKLGISFDNESSTYIPEELKIIQETKNIMYTDSINIFKQAFNQGPEAIKKLFESGFDQSQKIKNSSYLSYSFHQENFENFKALVVLMNDVSSDTIWRDLYMYSTQDDASLYLEFLIKNGKFDFKSDNYLPAYHFLNAIYQHDKYNDYKDKVSSSHVALFAYNKSINDEDVYAKLKNDVIIAINDYSDVISYSADTVLNLSDGYIVEDVLNQLIEHGGILISGVPLKDYLETVKNQASIGVGSLDVLERNFIQAHYKKAIDRI
jgi:hypothetical protein